MSNISKIMLIKHYLPGTDFVTQCPKQKLGQSLCGQLSTMHFLYILYYKIQSKTLQHKYFQTYLQWQEPTFILELGLNALSYLPNTSPQLHHQCLLPKQDSQLNASWPYCDPSWQCNKEKSNLLCHILTPLSIGNEKLYCYSCFTTVKEKFLHIKCLSPAVMLKKKYWVRKLVDLWLTETSILIWQSFISWAGRKISTMGGIRCSWRMTPMNLSPRTSQTLKPYLEFWYWLRAKVGLQWP